MPRYIDPSMPKSEPRITITLPSTEKRPAEQQCHVWGPRRIPGDQEAFLVSRSQRREVGPQGAVMITDFAMLEYLAMHAALENATDGGWDVEDENSRVYKVTTANIDNLLEPEDRHHIGEEFGHAYFPYMYAGPTAPITNPDDEVGATEAGAAPALVPARPFGEELPLTREHQEAIWEKAGEVPSAANPTMIDSTRPVTGQPMPNGSNPETIGSDTSPMEGQSPARLS